MPSKRDKLLLGAAGAVGAGVLTWRTMFPWIGYDLHLMKRLKHAGKLIKDDLQQGRFLIDMFEGHVKNTPNKPFIIFEDRIYTYAFVEEQANRVANIAMDWKLNVGETVAIMISNEPAFIWTFLGLQKLGLAVAFLNFHIKGQPLIHTVQACEAKVLIVGEGEAILQSVEEIKPSLSDIPIFVQGKNLMLAPGYTGWDELMRRTLPTSVCKSVRAEVNLLTPCCFIFTSGTTGLPKPAIISQVKSLGVSKFFQVCGFYPSDIIYTTTPLYHSAAGGLGLMSVLDQGATMVLRRKFSAQHYFEDIRKHNCTVVQYIGELCRYLLAVPESPLDGVHNVRAAVGNGLRPDIWDEFKSRFNIPNIYEFFGATEGTSAVMNIWNKKGSCGRLSPLINKLDPAPKYLVQYDAGSGEEFRDKAGRCILVKPGETGLLIGGIPPSYQGLQFYKGTKKVNEKKVMRDVFVPGDAYFNFGDLLEIDKEYFVYFKDRIGDTFRWKGENVATYEVSNILTQLDFIHDANVYGVQIAGFEGRAGMAALHLEAGIMLTKDILQQIFLHCQENLPSYARPLFLRFPSENLMTTTLKQLKTTYRNDGFDPDVVQDPLFYWDDNGKTFSPLTKKTINIFMAKSRL